MSDYKTSRDELVQALMQMTPDGPEWVKTKATIAALDDAERAEAMNDFVNASRRLDDAVAKLQAIIDGLRPNPITGVLGRVTSALKALQPVVQEVATLASGEPATALPGMALSNQPSFPRADSPATAPVREFARADGDTMASANRSVEAMIQDILRREGGYVDHPSDRGGPTNFGITLRTLSGWRKRPVLAEDVRALTQQEAAQIYGANYYSGPRIDQLPELLQPLLFDMSINHGPGTAIRLLQQVLAQVMPPCDVDGGIGDETLDCAKKAALELGSALVNRVVEARKAFYKQIVAGDASQAVFLKGWLNRANEFAMA